MRNHRRKTPRPAKRRPDSDGRTLQRMGGKEERTSLVGKARAEVERSEEAGEARFDIAPGPLPGESVQHPGRRETPSEEDRLPNKPVSPEPRGGPDGLEPEDKT